jgi:hypothetical protein
VTEFGGFLGLSPDDFEGKDGITERDMEDYYLPHDVRGIEAHFLGQYIPWDSRRNAEVAQAAGMRTWDCSPPCAANWWEAENLDNAQTGIHDYFGWLKFGYSRGTAQISIDVRAGNVTRERALSWVLGTQSKFPQYYMGVYWHDVLDRIGMSVTEFNACKERFTNKELHP